MSAYPLLFAEGRIGRMTTKNRIVMAPMVRNYAELDGRVTAKYAAHIERIARGGVGMMILEASYVSPEGRGFFNELGIHTDAMVLGLSDLVAAAHEYGAVIGPQLYHGGRQTSSAITGEQPVAPSAIPDPTINEIPRALSIEEIKRIAQAYGQGARRAKEAGCDFVEIHGAHGYLITQFLSSFSNARDDDYGGTMENRFRFLEDVVHAVRAEVGLDYPIIVRLSGEELVPEGLTLTDTRWIAQRLEGMGVNAVHISAGNYASYTLGYMIQPMVIPDGPLVPFAEFIKKAVTIPVITVGKIRLPDEAEDILRNGKADFIGLGRPLLADPDWPKKTRDGKGDTINKCIACNQGCISRLFEQQDVWCTVNPQTSREEIFSIAQTTTRRVVVAGGGPAGMETAKVAAGRGHDVTLFEEDGILGGQLIAAAAAPHRQGWEELRQYLLGEMTRLNVDVRLNTKATAQAIMLEKPDAVIVAIGSSPIRLKIPGVERANVINARDLLEGKAEAIGQVVIAGGGCSGAQTAEYLATRGHQVIIVEMLGIIAPDSPRAERELLLNRLEKLGVQLRIGTKILRVEENGVAVERPGGLDFIPADTVILCLGAIPNNGLAGELKKDLTDVITVGDAKTPRKVTEAMVEGALAALSLG